MSDVSLDDWRTPDFRQCVIDDIEMRIKYFKVPMIRTAVEIESFAFVKANTKEGYLAYIAKLLSYMKSREKKTEVIKQEHDVKTVQDLIEKTQTLTCTTSPSYDNNNNNIEINYPSHDQHNVDHKEFEQLVCPDGKIKTDNLGIQYTSENQHFVDYTNIDQGVCLDGNIVTDVETQYLCQNEYYTDQQNIDQHLYPHGIIADNNNGIQYSPQNEYYLNQHYIDQHVWFDEDNITNIDTQKSYLYECCTDQQYIDQYVYPDKNINADEIEIQYPCQNEYYLDQECIDQHGYPHGKIPANTETEYSYHLDKQYLDQYEYHDGKKITNNTEIQYACQSQYFVNQQNIHQREFPDVIITTNSKMSSKSSEEWRTTALREKMVIEIEKHIQKFKVPMMKTATEIENFAFTKSKTKEGYVSYIIKLLAYIRTTKKSAVVEKINDSDIVQKGEMPSLDWRTPLLRQSMIHRIEKQILLHKAPMSKTAVEIENHVFLKARTKVEYVTYISKLLMYIKYFQQVRILDMFKERTTSVS